MEFLKRFNRTSEAAALPQADGAHTCLTEQDVRRIAAEEIKARVYSYNLREQPKPIGPPLTLDQVRKMDRYEIMQRWPEVERALMRGE